jgi:hypothetical protein
VRLIDIYLLVYYGLVAGAAYALYVSGVLQRLPLLWTVGGGAVAVALGVMLWLLFPKPRRKPAEPE